MRMIALFQGRLIGVGGSNVVLGLKGFSIIADGVGHSRVGGTSGGGCRRPFLQGLLKSLGDFHPVGKGKDPHKRQPLLRMNPSGLISKFPLPRRADALVGRLLAKNSSPQQTALASEALDAFSDPALQSLNRKGLELSHASLDNAHFLGVYQNPGLSNWFKPRTVMNTVLANENPDQVGFIRHEVAHPLDSDPAPQNPLARLLAPRQIFRSEHDPQLGSLYTDYLARSAVDHCMRAVRAVQDMPGLADLRGPFNATLCHYTSIINREKKLALRSAPRTHSKGPLRK